MENQILTKIFKETLQEISPNENIEVGSVTYDFVKLFSIIVARKIEDAEKEKKQNFMQYAQDEYVDLIAEQIGLKRKDATFSSGLVKFYGNDGTKINIGSKVATEYNLYTVIQNGTIQNGSTSILVKCDKSGVTGNVGSGEINKLPMGILGVESCENIEQFTNGAEKETDESLKSRYFNLIYKPVTGGNESHYKLWSESVEGVGKAKVFPLKNGAGSVEILITNALNEKADEELILKTKKYIETQRPIGAKVSVKSANVKKINIDATIYTIKDIEFVKNEYINLLKKYFSTLTFRQNFISFAKLGGILLNIPEVTDHIEFKVNNVKSNIDLAENEIAVVGNITLIKVE